MKNILTVALMLSMAGCRGKYLPPVVETCVHNEENSAQCTDLRKEADKQDYKRTKLTNYWCTSASDQGLLYNYGQDLRSKLITCEADLKQFKDNLR